MMDNLMEIAVILRIYKKFKILPSQTIDVVTTVNSSYEITNFVIAVIVECYLLSCFQRFHMFCINFVCKYLYLNPVAF